MSVTDQQAKYHTVKMARKKAQIDASIEKANQQKSVLIVLTGQGKGKSTSGFGMVARALGHGLKVGVCQFIKSRTDTGEEAFFKTHPLCDWHVLGDGFTWDTQNLEQDITTSKKAWEVASKMLNDPSYDLVLLDELTYLLSYHYLPKESVLSALKNRPTQQHVVITGRSAIAELRELADTVSDIKEEKHAYKSGIMAQKGVDF